MGCGSSSPSKDRSREGSYDEEANNSDEGLMNKSNADLLHAQRAHPPGVNRGLEDRWIKSHFSDQALTKGDARTKRRRMSHINGEHPKLLDSYSISSDCINKESTVSTYDTDHLRHTFSILHFNDVYEIAERKQDPVGGAARLSALLKREKKKAEQRCGDRPLVVFGGDCLNPSTLSCATRGRHMIEILDYLGVEVAVFGNHEFDFGVDHAAECTQQMKSIWLLSNVVDKLTDRNLSDGATTHEITNKNGLKIGFIGLVEEEWLDTLATVNKSNLSYTDYVTRGRELAKELREKGTDFVVAVTHMRWPNDIRLAREVPDIDLVLGGHDHEYGVKDVDECLIIKSGSDFRCFSSIDIFLRNDGCVDVRLIRHDVTSKTPSDRKMEKIVRSYMTKLEKSLQACIGTIQTNLNGKFKIIRSQETALGNFVADIMASVTKADVVLINSGTFRSDAIHVKGDFRLHDLMTILPINDTVVIIVVTGKQLLEALENGVCKYPKLEGRFPQVSGLYFGFNPKAEAGKRIIFDTVRIRGQPLMLNETYRMATKAYVARGRDGYTCLSDCDILTDPDSSPLLSTVVRNHIMNVQGLLDFEKANSCQVKITAYGRGISCNKSHLDVSTAFKDIAAPVHIIQNSMKSLADGRMTDQDVKHHPELHTNDRPRQSLHLPNFIHIGPEAELPHFTSEPVMEKISSIRRVYRNADPENSKLLIERSNTPDQLRWQITPLIEARIFHCDGL